MLAERLALIERIRAAEHKLAGVDRSRTAALIGSHVHDLGNAIQVVELASLELARRAGDDAPSQLVDLRGASGKATAALAAMLAATAIARRVAIGPAVAPVIQAAVALARPAIAAPIELELELIDGAQSRLDASELEAIVLACALDVADAPRLAFLLRERTIERERWIELVRIDPAGTLVLDIAPPSWLAVVAALARVVGGELTLS
ncbi:MAG TPA: hypothetical protein VH143_06155, partial [Kofleriaceae bacterium]|nr:hypothetical protein [Kofleriaceae bacterium]